MSDNITTDAATELAARGMHVFPCHAIVDGKCTCGKADCGSPGKHPLTGNGFKNASDDAGIVKWQFGQKPVANIAIATGPQSRLWVLDLDGPEGIAAFAEIEAHHEKLPATLSASTGGGGKHIYFQYNGREIRNRAKIGGMPIDVRGDGGYVIAPPASHISGNAYAWIGSADTPIAAAPSWLVEFVLAKDVAAPPKPAIDGLRLKVRAGVDDVDTAPGAAKGDRHQAALRLIGSALGRGTPADQVEREALGWARRCDPPLADADVSRIVADLARKQSVRAAGDAADSLESEPLPEPIPWPTMDADAYYGLAGEIVEAVAPETEADPVAVLVQLLVAAGSVIGRQPFFKVGSTFHHANLFAVLVGDTSRGRKGTSGDIVRAIMAEVNEGWVTNNLKSGLASGEGLIWHVRDEIHKLVDVKEKGKVVGVEKVLADPGVIDKRLMVAESEFVSVLKVCQRERNTLSAILRSAWDSGILRTLTKNSPVRSTGAHISIVGHITAEELGRSLSEVDCFSGFANRFLWVCVRRSKLLPDGGRGLDLSRYADRLALAVEQAKAAKRLYRDPEAAELWRGIYPELAADDATGLLAATTSRAEAQALRLSMIYALLDGGAAITAGHLQAALAVWRYCRNSAKRIFGDAAGDPTEARILAAIRAEPGINRTGIHAATGRHLKAPALVAALARLRDGGRIVSKLTPTTGRPSEQWFLAGLNSHSRLGSANNQPADSADLCSLNSSSSQPVDTAGGDSVCLPSLNSSNSQPAADNTTGSADLTSFLRNADDQQETESFTV